MEHYGLIVIGAGSAARDAANKAAQEYGAWVALVERKLWGGSCPNDALARSHHVYPSWGEGVKAAAEQARPDAAVAARA